MSRNFAWPVFHRPAGDYESVAAAAKKGRDFRQPLQANGDNFSSGLELWIQDGKDPQQEDLATLFACWDGMLSFYPAKDSSPASLALEPNNSSFLNIVEPAPLVIYGNIDSAKVRLTMASTTLALYKADSNHPLLTSVFRVTKLEIEEQKRQEAEMAQAASSGKSKAQPLKKKKGKALDKQSLKERMKGAGDDATRLAIVTQVVDDWIQNSPSDRKMRLPVKAGDPLGAPATAFGNATGPSGYPFHLIMEIYDTSREHMLGKKGYFYEFKQYQQVRNPLHDLWIWLTSPTVTKLAPAKFGDAHPHPLVALTGLVSTAPKPLARSEVDTDGLRPYPLVDLATEWRGHDSSVIEWHLTDDVAIEARLAGTSGTLPDLDPSSTLAGTKQTFLQLAENIWTQHGDDISAFAKFFQVPCELLMAIMGVEDTSLKGDRVRFEGFRVPSGDTSREAKLYEALFIYPKGGSMAAPLKAGVIDSTAAIGTVADDTFTWGDLQNLLAKPAFQAKVSPGLMQTLISTAAMTLGTVKDWYTDILHDKGVTGKATVWATLGVDPRPGSDADLLTWLLKPRASLLTGCAYIRNNYNKEGTHWDPPRVATAYNAFSVKNPAGADKTWGLLFFDNNYMIKFAPLFNASVAYLSGTAGVKPNVRLRR